MECETCGQELPKIEKKPEFPEFENPFSIPTEEQPVTSNISGLAQVNPQLLQPPVTSVNTQIPYSQMNLAQRAEYDKLMRGI